MSGRRDNNVWPRCGNMNAQLIIENIQFDTRDSGNCRNILGQLVIVKIHTKTREIPVMCRNALLQLVVAKSTRKEERFR